MSNSNIIRLALSGFVACLLFTPAFGQGASGSTVSDGAKTPPSTELGVHVGPVHAVDGDLALTHSEWTDGKGADWALLEVVLSPKQGSPKVLRGLLFAVDKSGRLTYAGPEPKGKTVETFAAGAVTDATGQRLEDLANGKTKGVLPAPLGIANISAEGLPVSGSFDGVSILEDPGTSSVSVLLWSEAEPTGVLTSLELAGSGQGGESSTTVIVWECYQGSFWLCLRCDCWIEIQLWPPGIKQGGAANCNLAWFGGHNCVDNAN